MTAKDKVFEVSFIRHEYSRTQSKQFEDFERLYGWWHFDVERTSSNFNGLVSLTPIWMISEEFLERVKIKAKFTNFHSYVDKKYDFEVELKKVPYLPAYSFSIYSLGLNDDTSTSCKFSIKFEVDTSFPLCRREMESHSLPNAKTHLMELYDTGKYADITIKIKGKKDIRAHNSILSRSKVFDAMLNRYECKESRDRIIHIKDVDHDVMNEMIRFLYYDEIPRLKEMAVKLLIAGHKYEIPKLERESKIYLIENVAIENFAEVLVASDMLGIADLKEIAIDFIIENRKLIFGSDGWKALKESHNMLAWEVVEKFMCDA